MVFPLAALGRRVMRLGMGTSGGDGQGLETFFGGSDPIAEGLT